MSRSRLIFIVFYLAAVFILTVLLRTNSSRIFYNFRISYVYQNRLKQQLWHKQLTMASMMTPEEISRRIDKSKSESDGD
jgi:hypothetical protein